MKFIINKQADTHEYIVTSCVVILYIVRILSWRHVNVMLCRVVCPASMSMFHSFTVLKHCFEKVSPKLTSKPIQWTLWIIFMLWKEFLRTDEWISLMMQILKIISLLFLFCFVLFCFLWGERDSNKDCDCGHELVPGLIRSNMQLFKY